jgi:hypothetical protein
MLNLCALILFLIHSLIASFAFSLMLSCALLYILLRSLIHSLALSYTFSCALSCYSLTHIISRMTSVSARHQYQRDISISATRKRAELLVSWQGSLLCFIISYCALGTLPFSSPSRIKTAQTSEFCSISELCSSRT